MTAARAIGMAATVVALSSPLQAQARPTPIELWTSSLADSCIAVRVAWNVRIDRLRDLTAPRWEPRPGPLPGHGTFALVARSCRNSLIEGVPTGAFAQVIALIPVVLPQGQGADTTQWHAIPSQVGPIATPVPELFARQGFPLVDGIVKVWVNRTRGGREGGFTFATGTGSVEGTVRVSNAGTRTSGMWNGFGVGTDRFALAHGRESCFRQSNGSGTVSATGQSWLSRLGLAERPDYVAVDTDVSWAFNLGSGE